MAPDVTQLELETGIEVVTVSQLFVNSMFCAFHNSTYISAMIEVH